MLKMKELKLAIFLCITLMVAAVSPVHGQTGGTFVVNVMCSDTMGMPVMNDTVIFTNVQTNTSQAITSPTGDFPVSLPAGPYTVRIISTGFPVQFYAASGNTNTPVYQVQVFSDTSLRITMTLTPRTATPGNATVSGFVSDSTGIPVPNATITVLPVGGTNQPSTGLTSTDGAFSMSVPVSGSGQYMLQIYSSFFPMQYWTPNGMTMAATSSNGGIFSLMPNQTFPVNARLSMHPGSGGTVTQHVVHVTVSDSTGARLANDTVVFFDSSQNLSQSFTSATGDFPAFLPAGAYTVRIISNGFPIQFYSASGNTDMPVYRLQVVSDTLLAIFLTLTPQKVSSSYAVVSGFVRDSTGKPVPNSIINIVPLTGTGAGHAVCDSTGFFSVSVSATGTGLYGLFIHSSFFPPQYWTPAGTVSTPPTTANNESFPLTPNDTFRVNVNLSMHPGSGGTVTPHVVHVKVTDTTQMAVANATVMFIDSSNYSYQATTSATGVFPLTLPAGAYTVKILSALFPVQYYALPGNTDLPVFRFAVVSDTALAIALTLTPRKTATSYSMVTGFVYDSTGKPVPNSGVTVTPVGSSTSTSSDAVCDSNGHFFVSVPSMGTGLYSLLLHSKTYPSQYWMTNGTTMTPTVPNGGFFSLVPNDTFRVVVRLSMTPGSGGASTQHVVRVRVLNDTGGLASGCDVQFIDTSNYVREGFMTDMGEFSIQLPSSPYQVRLSYAGYPVQYYNLPVNSDGPKGRINITSDTLLVFSLTQTPMKINSSYGVVSGYVQDSVGRPVSNARVTLTQVGTSIVSASMMADSSGHFFASVPAMVHTIQISSPMYPLQFWTPNGTTLDPTNNTSFQIMSNDTVMVTIRMSTHPGSGTIIIPQFGKGFVAGHVLVKTTNQPAAGLMVIAVPRDTTITDARLYVGPYNAPYSDTVKADGSYKISSLPNGFYWVYVRGGAFINQYYPATDYSDSCVSIRVDSLGRTGIDFAVRTGGVIKGQLTSTVIANLDTIMVYANLNNNGGSNLNQWALTTNGGRFVISGLVAGSWNFSIDQSKGYLLDYSSGKSTQQVTVVEGKTDSGVVLVVTRGGFVSGTITPPLVAVDPISNDSMNRGFFQIGLYPDSVLKSSNQFPYEIQTMWANVTSPNTYVAGTVPAGVYRMIFMPNPPSIPRIDSVRAVACRSYAMAGIGPIPSILQSPLINIVAGDTTPNIAARFATGFSFLGHFSLEGGSRPNWARVDACIKDGNDYIPVCHGYVTTGDTMFQLAGLLDEKDYYLRCDADGYPTQWWSPSGAMSSAPPASPYHFSSLNFARPTIKMVKVPSGYYNNYTPFWVNTNFDSTNRLTLQWNIDASLAVDTFILYSKDREGAVSVLTRVPFVSGQQQYSWKETRDLSANQYSYVVVGKGPLYTTRTGTSGYDYYSGTPVAADSLWFSVLGDPNGISMQWTAGKNFTYSSRDSIVLYRKTGASGAWAPLQRQGSRNNWLSDNQWDRTADLGKTFYYQIGMVSGVTFTRWSAIRSITIDTAFVNRLSNSLSVGPSAQYKKIQDAVDNARDYDQINVDPGTYSENINLKGKTLYINGNWTSGGTMPVIDANGGTAITVPYPAKGSSWNSSNINGFKIQNALTGVNASGDVNVNQCLFVNVVRQCMAATIDSTSMVRAAAADPFNQYNIQMSSWQCTFIGSSAAGAIAHIGSQGTYESSTSSSSTVLTNPAMMVPATSFSSSVSVNNSILAGFGGTGVPLDMYGSRGHANFSNCDFWNTSRLVATTFQNQISMDSTIFTVDPHFLDSTSYFLPDSSPLRTMANNGSGIGYDDRRFNNNNGGNNNGPHPGPVQNFHFAIAGPHSVKLTWSPLAADQNSDRYIVYRVYGYDSLWYVNQGHWSPKVSNANMFSILDTFSTKDTFFVDTTPKLNFPYIYAVAGMTAAGNQGEVDFPFPPPLSAYVVQLKPLSALTGMHSTVLSFTATSLAWPSVGQGRVYSVYKIGLNPAAAAPDSTGMRAIIRNRAYTSIDSFTTRDSAFVDSTVVFGKPYCFVVASFDSAAGGMHLPLEQMPFTFSYVRISAENFLPARSIRCSGQAWSMIGPWGTDTVNLANAAASDIYHWDDLKQSDKLYSQYVPVSKMVPGAGYWFMPAADTVLSIDTADIAALSVKVTAAVPAMGVFKGTTGWNQIAMALPYPVSPSWLGSFTAYEWDADSNQYVQSAVLKPWKGYWVYSTVDTMLPLAGFPAPKSLAKKRLCEAQWELRVSLSGKKSRDPDNYCGVVPQSLAKTLCLASPKPPQAFDYPQLFFAGQSGVGQAQQKLARLYKSALPGYARQEWTVGISPSGEDMNIRVDGIASVPPKVFVFLVQNGTVYDLRKKNSVTVAAHKETVYGYLVATTDLREMALYSGNVELKRAYPNPFTTSAVIEFTLPYAFGSNGAKLEGESRNISLDIYNIAGRHIATLVSGSQPVGFYRKVWIGRSDAGSTVSSGFYIVRLSGQKFQKTSTLFKIR
jgi:protocatechuate 3,4-dioxygenase beta subunit